MSGKISSIADLSWTTRALFNESGLRWWFRGMACSDHVLLPSARRGYSHQRERYLSNEFRARAGTRHSKSPSPHDYSGWLSLMQHYGLPTRLMDWSFSPLVAAYFALHDDDYHGPPRDACIWAIAPSELNVAQGYQGYLYPLDANLLKPLLRPALKEATECECIVAAMAVENDLRMLMQQGAFTIHPTVLDLRAISGNERWLKQFIIPGAALPVLREELRLLGIRRDYVFPDLASLAKEMRESIPKDR